MTYATYADYLRSPVWAAIRGCILTRARQRCQACNSPHALEVHHRRYGVWGHEDDDDLICLCAECHTLFTTWQARRAEIIAELEERMSLRTCGWCKFFMPDPDISWEGECWRLHPCLPMPGPAQQTVSPTVSRGATCLFWERGLSETPKT